MFLRALVIIILLLTVKSSFAAAQVSIPESNLRAAIENVLDKAPGATITATEMATLNELEAPNANITDLTGLESATYLDELNLSNNRITDISALVGLTALKDIRPIEQQHIRPIASGSMY